MISELGFVPVEEIQNIFVTELTAIEEDIGINGMPMNKAIVFEWLDGIRQSLMKRAQHNIDDYVRKNPIVKVSQTQERANDEAKKKRQDSWQQKVKSAREEAIKECYK